MERSSFTSNRGSFTPSGVRDLSLQLLQTRRSKFRFVDPGKQGAFGKKSIPSFLFNSIASCLGIPVLFYISFHVYRLYATYKVSELDLLSVLFYSAALSIFVDVLIGYCYDRLTKLHLSSVKLISTVIGTIGMIICLAFLFRHDTNVEDALKHFRWTMLGLTIAYTLANATSLKNSMSLTPSQSERSNLFYVEYLVKAFFILAFVSMMYWIDFWGEDCTCGDICHDTPYDAKCTGCLDACDTTNSALIFRDVALGFTCFFGLINIINAFVVTPRTDEDVEPISTTINRRFSELGRNPLWKETFGITILQYIVLFSLAFWLSQFMDTRTSAQGSCADFWGSSSYLCTKSWMKQFALLLILGVIAIVLLVSLKKKFHRWLSTWDSLILIPAGILLLCASFNSTLIYFFVALFVALFYPTLATNQTLYNDAIFYDEYLSGSSQPYLLSAFYHLAVKLAFFVSLAFHLTLLEPNSDTDSQSTGGFYIFTGVAIFVISYFFVNKHDLHMFDKIHIAIERNASDSLEGLSFVDPIGRKERIRKPVGYSTSQERIAVIRLYNLDRKQDLRFALDGNFEKVKSAALTRLIIYIIALVVCTVVVIVFAKILNEREGWFIFIFILLLPITLYFALYNYNIWATAATLESKSKGFDPVIRNKFLPLTEPIDDGGETDQSVIYT